MKKYVLFAICVITAFVAIEAQATLVQTFDFKCVTRNCDLNSVIGEDQFFIDVFNCENGRAKFKFNNTGPENCTISEIYFYSDILLGEPDIDDSLPGVDFITGAIPSNLPGGDNVTPAFEAVTCLSAEAKKPSPKNGVNPNQWVALTYGITNGKNIEDVINELNTDQLRIGIHVQAFDNGGSESFITFNNNNNNNPTPIPEPTSISLLGMGVAFLFKKKTLFYRGLI